MINNTFQWDRFCKVVRKDFRSIWQNAGTSLLIITLLPIVAWLLMWAMAGITDAPAIVPEIRWCFIAGSVYLATMVAPSRMYRTCDLKKEGIYFAMLPASKLEKYLSMLLFTIFVCPLLCLCGGIVLDYFLTLLPFGPYRQWLWETDYLAMALDQYRAYSNGALPGYGNDDMELMMQIFTPGRGVLYLALCYLSNVVTFLFTNTIFKKHKVLQTLLWMWLISFAINILLTPIMGIMMVNGTWILELMNSADPVRTAAIAYWAAMAWAVIVTGVFYWWTWYRLKHMKY